MKTIILSLGGSLIVPDKVDISFLKNFKRIIEKFVKKNYKFVIICGGGNTARTYQRAIEKIIGKDKIAMDWVGISATYINALLVKSMFSKYFNKEIITNPTKKINFDNKIIIGAGWKPGRSTDHDAVLIAKQMKSKIIINLSNVEYVYEKDPKIFKKAKKIENICWKHYMKISGNKWDPGLNLPFDPVAAKEAHNSKLKVIIIGKNIKNFENLLNGKKFVGTVIE